jgi:hypothetical protein
MQFQRNISLLLGRLDPRRHVEFAGCTRATSALTTVNWVGGREMCVGGLRLGCRELHAGKIHTRSQRAGQVEAEVFLAADQASGPRGGSGSSLHHHRRAAQRSRWSSCLHG